MLGMCSYKNFLSSTEMAVDDIRRFVFQCHVDTLGLSTVNANVSLFKRTHAEETYFATFFKTTSSLLLECNVLHTKDSALWAFSISV